MIKEFFGDNVPDATGGAAVTNVLLVIRQIEAVIKGEFLSGRDLPNGDQPNPFACQFRFTVRLTTVIDEPGEVPFDISVEVLRVVQREDVFVIFLATPQRFSSADLFSYVLDHLSARGDKAFGKPADAMDGRTAELDQGGRGGEFHGKFQHSTSKLQGKFKLQQSKFITWQNFSCASRRES